MTNDVLKRLRVLRAGVAEVRREVESLRSSRHLTADLRVQLKEAAAWFVAGGDLLTPLPGQRVCRRGG